MKKLITGAVAALALLFGFASCSGDLHDNDVQPLGVLGLTDDAGNHVIPMKLDKADGSEQSLTFTLKDGFELEAADGKKYKLTSAAKNSWRNNNGNGPITASRFKVVAEIATDGTPVWTSDYGSLNKDDPQYITAGEDFQKVGKRGDANVSGDPKHFVLDGVIEGEEYVLRAKYNAAAGSLELKLDGTKNDPAGVKFVFADDYSNFPKTKILADGTTKDLSYAMTKSGTKYTYQFVSVKDETISFHLTNDMAGTLGGSLSESESNLIVNAKTVENMSLTVKENVEYKITVDTKEGISKPTIKYEVVDMLKDATVNANWKYAENFYATSINDRKILFMAEREKIDFAVVRHDGGVWGGDKEVILDADDSIELSYSVAKDINKSNVAKAYIKGLKIGSYYYARFDVDEENFTLKVKFETAPYTNLSLHALGIIETTDDSTDVLNWGTWIVNPTDGLSGDAVPVVPTAKKVSDSEYYFDFDLTGKTLSKGYCTIVLIKNNWFGDRYEMKKGSYKVDEEFEANTFNEEAKPRGLIKLESKKYRLKVSLKGPVANFLITEIE